jgi:signal transduction histidine kinase
MFILSRNVTEHDNQRLAAFQAQNVKTAVTALISQIDSAISSVGSVAAATNGNADAVDRLATADPAVDIFTALAILHRSQDGVVSITSQRGSPSSSVLHLPSDKGTLLSHVITHGGIDILGFFGHGATRRLALAAGSPAVPGGYIVYAEVPLPPGTTFASGYPGLQYALYEGRTEASPLLFATTKSLPLTGHRVTQFVNMDNLDGSSAPTPGDELLLFIVSSTGNPVGTLSGLLPWILAGAAILAGLLVAFVLEVTYRRKDEALILVSDLEDKNSKLDRALAEQAVAQETRERLESELRQAQRLEAVGRLAGGVAHDFNNLLAVILTYGEFIADELGTDHPLQADVAEVRKAASRAAELTRQLLVFSRRDLISPSVLDVNATINDLMNLLNRTLGEDAVLEAALTPGLPQVLADPGELEQVLVNLVVNARDAISGGGIITVETSEHVIDEDAASAHAEVRPGRYVRIAVMDTGCGMSPEVTERIFEPFFTTKAPGEGTGLGLSTVYGIANRYGGFVTVYSEIGVGTTFKVYLPATDEGPETAVVGAAPQAGISSGETVLLVEDEDAVRNACRRILERAGYRVLEANSGPQALAEIANEPIDLLLTDVIMPGGLSGRDLADRLQQGQPDLPVLFMSGYSADAIATRGILDPGVTVVEKPFSSSDLLGKVRELLP